MFTTDSLNLELILQCAKACDDCAQRVSGLSPDRRLIICCRDCAAKCQDLVEAISVDPHQVHEKSILCLHALERCAAGCELQSYDFCRETARLCRECAESCRPLAA